MRRLAEDEEEAAEDSGVVKSGRQHYLDASVAYKRAIHNAIDYLSKFGYSKEYVLHTSIPSTFCLISKTK